ncbi:hypothetical protein OO010_13045 [Flavobacteriaceae bacterium KMM 6898]|nr:hypothetical protein [Flavobacteriaceae bacterium KMM 6898]
MAPMKFEEQMKDKLDQRNLKPSEKAWETIASQLDTTQGSKRRNTFFWYGIAAGFIGIIVVSTIYFTDQDQAAPDQYKVVETEKLSVPIEKEEPQTSEMEQQVTLGVQEDSSNNVVVVPGRTIKNAVVSVQPNNWDHLSNGSNTDPVLDIAKQDIGETKVTMPNQTNEVINAKIAKLVEQVDWLDQNQMGVTDAEIDSLLRRAQQEIIQEQLFRMDNTVDAMALLTQVEDEMDQSFRDQIFDALREGFLKVRTAVATRNE